MSDFRLVVTFNAHISASQPYFHQVWRIAYEAVSACAPDVVVVTGDLSSNVPDGLPFAAKEIARPVPP
ncbi:MAG: hypothetical protein AAF968_25960 [Pseudomonadota bacterium]